MEMSLKCKDKRNQATLVNSRKNNRSGGEVDAVDHKIAPTQRVNSIRAGSEAEIEVQPMATYIK